MIFQTFDKGFEGWTSKIGILGTSFHDLGIAIRTSFQSAQDAVRSSDTSAGFLNTFRENLGNYSTSTEEYTKNDFGEIVTPKNIDAHIPKLSKEDANNKLADLRNWQKEMQNDESKKWSDILPPEKAENKYLLDLIRNTEDLSDLTGDDLVAANQRARASALAHNEAVKAQTLSAKAGKVALQGLATAGGMVAGFFIAKGIELAATAIDNLIHREERLAEAAKEASENIQNSFSSFNSMKQSTSDITQEFAQLSQHVNQATGENIDLPEEEYERFLELSNQLAETFPNIGYTIDENGNKITGLSGSIDEITQSINDLVQAQQALTHQEISDNMDDSYKKAREDITDYKNQIENLERQKTYFPDVKNKTEELLDGKKVKFQMSSTNDFELFNDMTNLFRRKGMNLQFQNGHLSLNQTTKDASLSNAEIEQMLSDADQLETKYANMNKPIDQQIADLQNKMQMSMNSFSPDLTSWLTTDSNYSGIVQSYGSDLGTAIQKTVQSIDLTDLDSKNWDGAETWINDNILAPLNIADNNEIRQAYIELFTNTDIPLDSAIAYLSQIEEYYHDHDIEIPTIFTEQKEKYSDLRKEFDDRNASFQTGNVYGLNQFFQENSIDEADEYEKWLSVTDGITDATEAMEAWKLATEQKSQPPISFQESWDSLDTTGSDDTKQATQEAKEQLLELAEAGKLTAEELEKSPAGKTIMEQTKLSAEEATEAVNKLADKSSQLSIMKSGIQSISSVLAQKQENLGNSKTKTTGIDSSTLSGFDASIKGLESWKQFEETLGNGKSSMEDCQQAANKLASEWVNSNNFLSQLEDTNKEYYISQLKGMGVENAHSIVTDILNQKKAEEAQKEREIALEKEYNKQSSIDLTQADCKQIDALGKFVGWTDETKEALYRLALQKRLTNGTTLDFSSDLDTIIDFGDKLGYSTKKLKQYRQVLSGSGGSAGMPSDVAEKLYGEPAKKEYENIKNDGKKKKKKKVKVKVDPSSDPTEENPNDKTNTPTETKETKQSFDWLERRISILTSKLDLLKAKIENVFNVQQKNSILDDEIKKTNALINTYKKQEKTYKAQAKKSAKSKKTATDEAKLKLTGKKGKQLIKQIQTGQIKGSKKQWIKAYNAKTANAIEEYQDYWDKYQTAKKNRQDAIKSRRELKIQKRQNWVDYYDALSGQKEAEIENLSTAKEKNKLEKDRIDYIKKSYDKQIEIAKLEKDSVKAATLLAQKWKEIADSRDRILQNQLDENADNRDYNNAAYENADKAGKQELIQNNIASYNSDNRAYTTNVNSSKNDVKSMNGNVTKTGKAVTAQMKKDKLNKSTMKKIQSYINKGQKIPDDILSGTMVMLPDLYQKLVAYNNSIDAAKVANEAVTKAEKNQKLSAEKNETNIREERSKSIQLDIDSANNKNDRLAAEYENLTTASAKNSNIDKQLEVQRTAHEKRIEQLKNNITDPEELNDAIAKENAEWDKLQREQHITQLQNLSDEQSAQYNLNQQKETNAETAKEKNKYEALSRENLKNQYTYEIKIAEKNGDLVEAQRQRLELEQKIEESYLKQIDNIREEYDLILGMNNAKKSTTESQIAALQANGYGIAAELYLEQQEIDLTNYQDTLSKIRDIKAEMQNLDPESQAYQNYLIELESYKQEAWGYQQDWAEKQQAINDINLAKIERIGTMLQYNAENLEHIQNILSHSDFTLSDKDIGGLTMEGLSNIAVTFAQMSNNSEQIGNLYDQIAEKRSQLESAKNVNDYDRITEDIENLTQQANELEEANYDFGESIKDLVVESLNSLSDALDESISKYKDALQAQKDLYDYRQKVAGQLKSIASLEKQLAALQGSDTEEARARIQKLQVELEDEQQNLKDMEYDKYIQDQEEMLDKISDDFQDFIANVANMSVSKICTAMSNVVTNNLKAIGKSIASSFYELSLINGIASDTDSNGLGEMLDNLDYEGKVSAGVDGNGNVHYEFTDDGNNKTDITADNKDAPGTIIGVTVNGEDVTPADKEVTQTGNKIEAATHDSSTGRNNILGSKDDIEALRKAILAHAKDFAGAGDTDGSKQLKRSIEGYIETLNSYVSDSDAGMSLSIDPLNQFLYTEHGKMATSFQKYQILKKLGLLQNGWGDEKNPEILGQAVEKLQHLGFSQGGIATYLNRIALANGDDGWATLKRGESVLTQAQTEQFQKLTNNLVPLNTIAEAIASLSANPTPINHSPAATTTTVHNVDIHLDGSHVMDADSFIQTLHNPRVLQEVSSGVSSQLGNIMSNKLGTF